MLIRSFLEFVARKLLGRPYSGSCWRCPFCQSSHGSFSVRPPKGNLPVKYRCWRCNAWGDEYDLFKHFFPDEHFGWRRARVAVLRKEYESGKPPDTDNFSSPGRIRAMRVDDDFQNWLTSQGYADLREFVMQNEFEEPANSASQAVMNHIAANSGLDPAMAVRAIQRALESCHEHKVHPMVLASRLNSELWNVESPPQ